MIPNKPPNRGHAGIIVRVIATTNAVISGLITLKAMKLPAQVPAACKASLSCSNVAALQYGKCFFARS